MYRKSREVYEQVQCLPSEEIFCKILAYAFHYHRAVARFGSLNWQLRKRLRDGNPDQELQKYCIVDPDMTILFKVLGTVRPLGIWNTEGMSVNMKWPIEFPTKNQLKVFLARLIIKRRK